MGRRPADSCSTYALVLQYTDHLHRLSVWQADRIKDRLTKSHADRPTNRHADRQTEKDIQQTDMYADHETKKKI